MNFFCFFYCFLYSDLIGVMLGRAQWWIKIIIIWGVIANVLEAFETNCEFCAVSSQMLGAFLCPDSGKRLYFSSCL